MIIEDYFDYIRYHSSKTYCYEKLIYLPYSFNKWLFSQPLTPTKKQIKLIKRRKLL